MEGQVQVEAHGFGISLRTSVLPGESPQSSADRLVLAEDRRRRALHNAWLRGQDLTRTSDASPDLISADEFQRPSSLVVVSQDQSALVA